MNTLLRTTLATLALGLSTLAAPAGDNWPGFRGSGDGLSDSTGLPLKWGEKLNVRWKTAIHDKGWSSPVVWGRQVWLTTARADGKQMFAVCVDRDSGKVLHDVKVFDVEKPAYCIPFNSYASPTPAIEEGRIYVHFGTYGTACLDTASARVLWSRRDLPCNHFRGPGSSPLLWHDLLFIPFDGFDLQYVVALDKATGRTVWKKDRDIDWGGKDGDNKKAYATPAVIQVNGRPQLVSPAAVATLAYDPATGKELWKVYHGGMNAAPPPLSGHGLVFFTSGSGKLMAVRPDGSGDVTASHVAWQLSRAVPTRCGPLLVGDLLYMVSEGGVVSCLEARTGTAVWQRRLSGKFSASPVYADGHLYFCDEEKGVTSVLKAGRTPEVVAVNKLDDGFMASPAVAGKSLFLRTRTHLYRIEQK